MAQDSQDITSADGMMLDGTNEINTNKDDDYIISERTFVSRLFFLAVCHIFMLSSRQPVWILYAKQFNNTSYDLISTILFAGLLWKGIISLITVSLANKYGYDKSVLILLFIIVFAIFLECIATNFIILSIGFFLSQVGIINVVLACIAWLLPHKIAVNYTSYLFATIIVAYLLGPVVAGAIGHFLEYRWVFWINFLFGIFTIIYALKFIPFNIQKKIEQKQLQTMNQESKNENINKANRDWKTLQIDMGTDTEHVKITEEEMGKDTENVTITEEEMSKQEMVEFTEIAEDEMYPICLLKIKNQNNNTNSTNLFRNVNLSKYEWFMLIASIICTLYTPFCECIVSIYYCLYVIDKVKHGNILNASIQLLLMAIGAIIGKLSAPKLINNINKNYKVLNKYIVLLSSSSLISFETFFVYPNSYNINMLYLYTF
eukprot:384326_1